MLLFFSRIVKESCNFELAHLKKKKRKMMMMILLVLSRYFFAPLYQSGGYAILLVLSACQDYPIYRRETLKLCLLFNIITGRLVHPSCLLYSYTLLMPITIETLSNLSSLKLIATSYLFHQQLRDGMLSNLIQIT